QTPPPDFQVKQNRKIYLTVIATSKEKVEIKNYKGVSLRQAMSMLETRGLLLDSIVTRPYDFEGTVLGLEYEGLPLDSGSTVEKGTAVSIVVGAGLGKSKVLLPNLVGRTFAQAKNELNAKGLNARLPYCPSCPSPYDPPDSAQVVLQEPEYEEGESINLGSGVKLELALEFDPNIVSGDTTVSYPDTTQSPTPPDE
ncbi:MAG: PASTA domain-containing protein, partial [Bacteroidota bacterium]